MHCSVLTTCDIDVRDVAVKHGVLKSDAKAHKHVHVKESIVRLIDLKELCCSVYATHMSLVSEKWL
jgi:hypothetical protein